MSLSYVRAFDYKLKKTKCKYLQAVSHKGHGYENSAAGHAARHTWPACPLRSRYHYGNPEL